MANQQMVLPRVGYEDETTFAVVSWAGPSREDFLPALKRAVTNWVCSTSQGKKAWEDSSENFNIGDLANCTGDSTLKPYLAKEGITYLEIDTYCDINR